MDLRQLATFQMVASTLNFTQAAAALGYAQSSVTAQVQALEADLGVTLFERHGKRIQLTEAGKRLLPYADHLLALADEARTALHRDSAMVGTLTISAPETLLTYRLPEILQAFCQRYPGVQMRVRPCPVRDLRRHVSDGVLDVAFILGEPTPQTRLSCALLHHESIRVVAPPDHRLAHLKAVYAADLDGETFLFTELGCTYRNLFEHTLIAAGVYPSHALEFSSVEAIKQCIIAGMGIGVLPAIVVQQQLDQGQLIALPWADQSLDVTAQVFWRPEKSGEPIVQAFIEMCGTALRA